MGASSSKCDGSQDSGIRQNDRQPIIEKDDIKRRGSSRKHSSGETVHCPTCQGTGRIPRDIFQTRAAGPAQQILKTFPRTQHGQESKLVAVIPCTDQRLRPRHTKLYVAVSVGICLLVSSLVLFFLFPRSVLLSPVAVKSSYVYFTEQDVQINITNVVNITNRNFAPVQAYNLTVQALNFGTVVGRVAIKNVANIQPLSIQTYSFVIPIKLTDPGLCDYCKKPYLHVHILYLHLQMSMTVYYLAHYEQLSLETYEYIDCGANSTIPHSVQPPPT